MEIVSNSQNILQAKEAKTIWNCPSISRIEIKQTLSQVSAPANDGAVGFTDP